MTVEQVGNSAPSRVGAMTLHPFANAALQLRRRAQDNTDLATTIREGNPRCTGHLPTTVTRHIAAIRARLHAPSGSVVASSLHDATVVERVRFTCRFRGRLCD